MTKINVVPPEELHRELLLMEYRAVPLVFKLIHGAQKRGLTPATASIPSRYTTDKWHAHFFYDKGKFLVKRYVALVKEMVNRGIVFDFRAPHELSEGLDAHWLNDWEPDDLALYLNRLKLRELTAKMQKKGTI